MEIVLNHQITKLNNGLIYFSRQNQKVNKGLAMTLLYKHGGYTHSARAPQDDLLLVLDPATGQVLLHQKQLSAPKKKIQIPMVRQHLYFSTELPLKFH